MKSLKYILLGSLLSLAFSFNSCDLKQNTGNNKSNDSTYSVSIKSVKTMKNDTLDILQLDSLTKADKLPEYNKWIKTPIEDGDDSNVYEYSTLYDKTTGIIYTIKQIKHNQYVVQKKKTTAK